MYTISRISPLLCVLAYLNIYELLFVNCWKEYDIQSIEQVMASPELFEFKFKQKRVNRTSYAVNATIVLKTLDVHNYSVKTLIICININMWKIKQFHFIVYQVKAETFYSSMNNNQYVKSPLKLAKKNICDVANKEYRKYGMDIFKTSSNLPYTDDESVNMCTLFELVVYEEWINR